MSSIDYELGIREANQEKTATLSKAFTLLHGMKTKLGIPNNVVENAAYIYRKAVLMQN